MSFVDATPLTYLHFDWCRLVLEGGSHWGNFCPQVTFCDLGTRAHFLAGHEGPAPGGSPCGSEETDAAQDAGS